jgi:hypothetical protein
MQKEYNIFFVSKQKTFRYGCFSNIIQSIGGNVVMGFVSFTMLLPFFKVTSNGKSIGIPCVSFVQMG